MKKLLLPLLASFLGLSIMAFLQMHSRTTLKSRNPAAISYKDQVQEDTILPERDIELVLQQIDMIKNHIEQFSSSKKGKDETDISGALAIWVSFLENEEDIYSLPSAISLCLTGKKDDNCHTITLKQLGIPKMVIPWHTIIAKLSTNDINQLFIKIKEPFYGSKLAQIKKEIKIPLLKAVNAIKATRVAPLYIKKTTARGRNKTKGHGSIFQVGYIYIQHIESKQLDYINNNQNFLVQQKSGTMQKIVKNSLSSIFRYLNAKAPEGYPVNKICVSCHEMDPVIEEYKQNIHYKTTGQKASCEDCHLGHGIMHYVMDKYKALPQIGQHLKEKYKSQEEFANHRYHMGRIVQDKLAYRQSSECKVCHHFSSEELAKQLPAARKVHATDIKLGGNLNCIKCHNYGVGHKFFMPPKGKDTFLDINQQSH